MTRSPAAARAILDARARVLARPIATSSDGNADIVELLYFQVGEEQMALPLANIVAIAPAITIAPLPRAVPPVYGVCAWRGRPLTVLSLATTPPVITGESRLVVLGSGARAALAVVVDTVHDVGRTNGVELAPAGPGPRHAYALGIGADGLLVLSADALLNPEALHDLPSRNEDQ